MRLWHSAWSWFRRTSPPPLDVAVYALTGTETRLSFRNPFQLDRAGMDSPQTECHVRAVWPDCDSWQWSTRRDRAAEVPGFGVLACDALSCGTGCQVARRSLKRR